MRVGIINYGTSNLLSVVAAVRHIGHEVEVLGSESSFENFDAVILPGVGDFQFARTQMKRSGLDLKVIDFASLGKRVVGICLGMQLLGLSSTENGFSPGLNLIQGNTRNLLTLSDNSSKSRIPRMGWYQISEKNQFGFIKSEHVVNMYFAHSFYMQDVPEDKVIFESRFGEHQIVAGVKFNELIGVQFHPEKSGEIGIKLLQKILKA